jgi:hypothetical protein
MLQRHSLQEYEADLQAGQEKPGPMTMLNRDSAVADREEAKLEPYRDFEHAPQPRQKESKETDALSEQNVAVWVAILFLIGLSVLAAYFFWARLNGL